MNSEYAVSVSFCQLFDSFELWKTLYSNRLKHQDGIRYELIATLNIVNRESLLKSIKNNKHNHLTATYYLLLKKHMIRHLRPYCDAFLELKLREEQKDGAGPTDLYDVNLKN